MIESIKQAQDDSPGFGGVPEDEISAVDARASQLKAFMTNADSTR